MILGNRVEVIIDGGPVYPDPSSLIDLTGDRPEVLRKERRYSAIFVKRHILQEIPASIFKAPLNRKSLFGSLFDALALD